MTTRLQKLRDKRNAARRRFFEKQTARDVLGRRTRQAQKDGQEGTLPLKRDVAEAVMRKAHVKYRKLDLKVTAKEKTEAEQFREKKALTLALKNAADFPKERRSKKKPTGKIEPLIRAGQGWSMLEFSEEQAQLYEKRDAKVMKAYAEGYAPPCPLKKYVVEEDDQGFRVLAIVRQKGRKGVAEGWAEVGSLRAWRDSANGPYVAHWSETPYSVLATCPGLGTGLYEAAAREACKRGTTLAGSDMRSPFSEKFWKRQVKNGRATCNTDTYASIYGTPVGSLRYALTNGAISVPQYNKLRKNLPARPTAPPYWECANVPLKACTGKVRLRLPVDNTLHGLRKRAKR